MIERIGIPLNAVNLMPACFQLRHATDSSRKSYIEYAAPILYLLLSSGLTKLPDERTSKRLKDDAEHQLKFPYSCLPTSTVKGLIDYPRGVIRHAW